MAKSTAVFDALNRAHRLRRMRRRKRFLRFRLRTLILFMTAVALLVASVTAWQAAIANRFLARWEQMLSSLPTTSAADMALVLGVFCCFLLGSIVFGLMSRQDGKRGFWLFALLSCAGFVALFIAMGLETEPLRETELKDLRAAQIARTLLMWFACVVPVSAFLGWYCSIFTKRDY